MDNRVCPKCLNKNRIEKAKQIHDNKYDYNKSDFSKVKTKTVIICKEHGEFNMSYDKHVNCKNGCKYCSKKSRDTESFVKCAKEKHNDKYDYSKVEYVRSHDKVCIICKEHGEFHQTPNAHLNGQGCPKCKKNSLLENEIHDELTINDIVFETQKHFEWLGSLSLDFYIPSINLAIECQGKQHFGLGGWSEKFDFEAQKERDERKKELCDENGVKLIYYTNVKNCNMITDKNKIIKEIFNKYEY